MKLIKLTAFLLITMMLTTLLAGCDGGNQSEDREEPDSPVAHIRVGALRGPTGMGIAYLMDKSDRNLTVNQYTFTIGGTPEEMTAGLISGELDIAMVPVNLASVLYNRTEGEIRVLSINTLGILYILDATGEINSIDDLRGRTINATGQGAVPQYALEYILRGNGMEPGVDVEIVYNTEHTELASLMVAGDVSVGMLPQPFVTTVTMQNSEFSIALDLTSEWASVNPATGLIMGNIVVNAEFLEQNPDAVELFLSDYAQSVAFVNNKAQEAAQLIERFDIAPAAVAQAAIPGSNLVHIEGAEMRSMLKAFLQIMFEANPQSVGGSMPDEDFYFVNVSNP